MLVSNDIQPKLLAFSILSVFGNIITWKMLTHLFASLLSTLSEALATEQKR